MSPSIHEIEALIASAQRRHGAKAEAIGIFSEGAWNGPPTLDVGGASWRIAHASSALRARRLLSGLEPGERMALLTPLDEGQLGLDILSRFVTSTLTRVEPWQMVRDAFAASRFDPRLAGLNSWIPKVTSQLRAMRALAPAPEGVLTPEHLWSEVFEWLGMPREIPPIDGMLALEESDLARRWTPLPEECRRDALEWIGSQRGVVAMGVFRCLVEPDLPSPLAVGIALEILLSPELAGDDETRSRGWVRLEDAGCVLPDWNRETLRAWASESIACLRRMGVETPQRLAAIEAEGREFLRSTLRLDSVLKASSVFPEGLGIRKSRTARAIDLLLKSEPAPERLDTLAAAAEMLRQHVDGEGCDPQLAMAERLARFLTTEVPDTIAFEDLAAAYRDEISWVDRALATVGEGESDPELGTAYQALAGAVRTRRDEFNERFGQRLTEAFEEDAAGIRVLERTLAEVVDPLVRGKMPVLLIVLDGMSWAIAHAIFEWIGRRKQLQRVTGDRHGRWKPLLAPLPSITNVARTSLLCGELAEGGQSTEQNGFLAAARRFEWKTSGHKELVFHKAGLEGPDRLGSGIRKVLGGAANVVAAVVNAIDDQLSTNGQLRPEWTERDIPVLKELIDAAEVERRAVVIVADHGHVVDVPGVDKVLAEHSTDRWRSPIDPPRAGEVRVSGRRVMLPERGGPIVVPFDDRTRYTARKAGYHGGASPQELVCPMAVFAPTMASLPDAWTAERIPPPVWWDGATSEVTESTTPPRSSTTPRTPVPDMEPSREVAADTPAPTAETWIAALVESPLFESQRRKSSRRPISAERVQAVLEQVVAAGGTTGVEELAVLLQSTTQRLRSQLAIISTILNLEQYLVFEFDEAANRITFDAHLARIQFGLADDAGGDP